MAVLCAMPTIQYSARSARLSVRLSGRGLLTSSGHAHLDSRRFRQPASDVAENLKEVSCTKRTGQGNDFELIPTVKVETRLPVEGSSGNKFPSIYNHCGVMAA